MTYLSKSSGLGDIASKVSAGIAVARDPALDEVSCLVLRLNAVTERRDPGPVCTKRVYTEAQKTQGVGLYQAIKPLRTWLWVRENPALTAAIGASALVALGLVLATLGGKK